MSSFLRKILCFGATALGSFMLIPAQANVMLTFNVNHVNLRTCVGRLQPNCNPGTAADFKETMVIDDTPLGPPTDKTDGAIRQGFGLFNFPLSRSGSPYTSALLGNLGAPMTSSQSFVQVENAFDQVSSAGTAAAGIFSDIFSDTKDAQGVLRQQGYHLGYTLFGQFDDAACYTDLVDQSLDDFFTKYIGTMFGSFDELGSNGVLDPGTLDLTDYAFLEYRGDVTLVGVDVVGPVPVPEPGTLALLLAAALGMLGTRRRRMVRPASASL